MRSNNKLLFGVLGIGSGVYVALMIAELPWIALGVLLVSAVIFIAILVGKSKAYTNQINTYRIITVVALLLITAHGVRFAFDYSRKDYQKELLLEIRGTIERGVAKSDIMEKGFYIYRAVEQGEYTSITEATDSIIGDRLLEDNVYLSDFDTSLLGTPSGKDDNADFFYEKDEAEDIVKFIVVANIPPGADPNYENYNGNSGRFEMQFIISKEGVEYEVLN